MINMVLESVFGTEGAEVAWSVITVVGFVLVGFGRTYYSAHFQHDEKWKWTKGKYELGIFAVVGGLAGLYVLFVGGSMGGPLFGGAIAVAGIIARKAQGFATDTAKRRAELVEQGMDTEEAWLMALRYSWENNEMGEIEQLLDVLFAESGRPKQEKAAQNIRETREAYEEGGIEALREHHGLFPEDMVEGEVDDAEDFEGIDPFGPDSDLEDDNDADRSDDQGTDEDEWDGEGLPPA